MIIIAGFIAGRAAAGQLPGRPGGAAGRSARSAGSAATWSPPRSATPPKAIAIGIPSLNIDLLIDGLEGISPLLATAIPLGIYNFTEAMSNVESRRRRGRQLQPAPRAAGRRHRRRRRRRARLAVPARRLHRPPGLEGRRRTHLLLAGDRRRDLPAVRVRVVPAARGAAADPRDRAGAAVHRPRDRLAGVRRGAQGALRGGRAGGDPVAGRVGLGHGPRRAAGRGHERAGGRRGGAGQRRRALRRAWRRSAPARCSWAWCSARSRCS